MVEAAASSSGAAAASDDNFEQLSVQELAVKLRLALAEADALRSLPPPPPIGAEMFAEQAAELDDLRARCEVNRRQIGALVFEKGRLNELLKKKEEVQRSSSVSAMLL